MRNSSIRSAGRRSGAGFALLAGFAAVCVLASPVAAQDKVADFYKGKTITLYVGSTSGGGYDLYGRLIARHIGRYIPGHPSLVVQNMPGAGSITLTQFLYNAGPKDGTAFGAIFPGAIMQPLLQDNVHVKYEPAKLNYIGSANSDSYVCIVRNDAPIKNFSEAFTKQKITLGASGGGDRRSISRPCSTTCWERNSRSCAAIRAAARFRSPSRTARCRARAASAGRR